jgi:hypothetical protein
MDLLLRMDSSDGLSSLFKFDSEPEFVCGITSSSWSLAKSGGMEVPHSPPANPATGTDDAQFTEAFVGSAEEAAVSKLLVVKDDAGQQTEEEQRDKDKDKEKRGGSKTKKCQIECKAVSSTPRQIRKCHAPNRFVSSPDHDDSGMTAVAAHSNTGRPRRQAAKRVHFDHDECDEEEDESQNRSARKENAYDNNDNDNDNKDDDDDDGDDDDGDDDDDSFEGSHNRRGHRRNVSAVSTPRARKTARRSQRHAGMAHGDDSDFDSDDDVRLSLTAAEQAKLLEDLRSRQHDLQTVNQKMRGLSPGERKKMRNRKASSVSRIKKKLATAILWDQRDHYEAEAKSLYTRLLAYEPDTVRTQLQSDFSIIASPASQTAAQRALHILDNCTGGKHRPPRNVATATTEAAASYSVVPHILPPGHDKCVCGDDPANHSRKQSRCEKCSVWFHMLCVNEPDQTNHTFVCPRCS